MLPHHVWIGLKCMVKELRASQSDDIISEGVSTPPFLFFILKSQRGRPIRRESLTILIEHYSVDQRNSLENTAYPAIAGILFIFRRIENCFLPSLT